MSKPVCAVVGVGEGNGAALARAFANEGTAVALLARRTDFTSKLAEELPDARAYACDAADPDSVAEAFGRIREEMGDPSTLVYNAGSGVWGDVESIGLEDFAAAWRVNALGALAASRAVIPAMKAAASGTANRKNKRRVIGLMSRAWSRAGEDGAGIERRGHVLYAGEPITGKSFHCGLATNDVDGVLPARANLSRRQRGTARGTGNGRIQRSGNWGGARAAAGERSC